MMKLTTALALCCLSLSGFAQEETNEIVKETEVTVDVETSGAEDTTSNNTETEQDKGGN